jgi:hypothetical protein
MGSPPEEGPLVQAQKRVRLWFVVLVPVGFFYTSFVICALAEEFVVIVCVLCHRQNLE